MWRYYAGTIGILCFTAVAFGQPVDARTVQIRSIDFDAAIVEVFNFGALDQDLTNWRFCSHDFDQNLRYTASSGLNGVILESGTSVYIHFNNDAPGGDPDRINRSSLGGSFATPLDQDAYGMQFFFPDANGNISFGNSTLIADHIQWNIDGQGVGAAEQRTAQAVSEGLWTAVGDFIPTAADSSRIILIDASGDEPGAPDEYLVVGPEIYNEAIDPDASDDPNAPTVLPLATGGNAVRGEVIFSNDPSGDRDFFTVTVPAGQQLVAINLTDWGSSNLGFIAVNAGSTGFIPSGATDANFLSGILVSDFNLGDNLLDNFQNQAVTQNSLPTNTLGPGDYTFVIQQTTNLLQSYGLDFVLADAPACPQDLTGDGAVTGADLNILLSEFGSPCVTPPACGGADFDGDGNVSGGDLNLLLSAFGPCP